MRTTFGLIALLVVLGAPIPAEAVAPAKRGTSATATTPAPAAPPAEAAEPAPLPEPTHLTIVLVGDTGFAPHLAPVRESGVSKGGRSFTFAEAAEKIASRIDGDINFANIETAVTDSNSLPRTPKTFSFRMHPLGMRHLVERGFNLLSLANNHALDYGQRGAGDTLRHMAEIAKEGKLLGHAGLGASFEEAAAPARFTVKGVPFAFSAMGIGGGAVPATRLPDGQAGQLDIHSEYKAVVARLAAAPARVRILSMHFGQERQAQPGGEQLQRWREEISRGAGIDIIVGHHSHIPQGIELVDGRLILYGMGNFLHQGMSDMGGNNNCRDWGVMAKVHLLVPAEGRARIAAVEVIPVYDMHMQARTLAPSQGRARILAMNGLSRALGAERAGGEPLRLLPQEDGTGLFCAPGSADLPDPLKSRCAPYRALERLVDGRLIADVPASACGYGGEERVASTDDEPRRARGSSSGKRKARYAGKRKGKSRAAQVVSGSRSSLR